MSDERDFDPRFDAAFQRGYQGVVDAAPRAPKAAAPSARVVEDYATRDETARAAAAQNVVVQEIAPEVFEESDELSPQRRVNPFLIALAIAAAALIGGGLYVVSRLPGLYADSQTTTNFDFVTLQVLVGAAPLSVALGVATALGIVFVLALRWGRPAR